MVSKIRVFFNWVITIFLGSFICNIVISLTLKVELDYDFFWTFVAFSSIFGLIPLGILLIAQHTTNDKLGLKKRLVTIQMVSYVIISPLILLFLLNILPEGYAIFLIGLPYLIVGISLTLALPNPIHVKNEELKYFKA